MPWHQGGLSRSRPNRDFDRDRGNPDGIGAKSGKFSQSRPGQIGQIGIQSGKIPIFDGQNRHCRLSATGPASAVPHLFLVLESIFQDPCPTLNGTRRVTMPQVLTRRSEPITLLAKRGHRHLQTQKLALVVIRRPKPTVSAQSHSHTIWVLLHTEQLHPSPRLSSHSRFEEAVLMMKLPKRYATPRKGGRLAPITDFISRG